MKPQIAIEQVPDDYDAHAEHLHYASSTLNTLTKLLVAAFGLTAQEIVDLLEAEEHWWAEDKFVHLVEDKE